MVVATVLLVVATIAVLVWIFWLRYVDLQVANSRDVRAARETRAKHNALKDDVSKLQARFDKLAVGDSQAGTNITVGDLTANGQVSVAGGTTLSGGLATTTVNATTVNTANLNVDVLVGDSLAANSFVGGNFIGNQHVGSSFQGGTFTGSTGTFSGLSATTGAFDSLSASDATITSADITTATIDDLNVGGTLSVTGAASLSSSLDVTGATTIGGTAQLNGNTALGNASSDTISFNGRVDTDLIPSLNGTFDLGSPLNQWQDVYALNLVAANTTIAGTTSQSFTVNSDAPAGDTENASLVFFRGAGAPSDAIISWNATSDRFELNQPVDVAGVLTATTLQGDGAGLTNLNASSVASGTLADARLTANVSLLGQTIGTTEIEDLAITNIKLAGGITDDKLSTISTAGKVADSALSTNVALLGGRAGGQLLQGGTAASENLTLSSTAHATKGKILFGTSAYDEVNNRLGIGTASPGARLHVDTGAATTIGQIVRGAASQTADLQQWQDSAGDTLLSVRLAGTPSTGGLEFKTAGVTGTVRLEHWNNGVGQNRGLKISGGSAELSVDGEVRSAVGFNTSLVSSGLTMRGNTIQRGSAERIFFDSAGASASAIVIDDPGANTFGSMLRVQPGVASSIGQIIRGAASQTADLLQLQNSAGTALVSFQADGSGLFQRAAGASGPVLQVNTDNAAGSFGPALRLKATHSGNSALVLQVLDYADTQVASITRDGNITTALQVTTPTVQGNTTGLTLSTNATNSSVGIGVAGSGNNSALHVRAKQFNFVGQIVQGVASQTGDLTQWQDSAGTAVGKVKADGTINGSVLSVGLGSSEQLILARGGANSSISHTNGTAGGLLILTSQASTTSGVRAAIASSGTFQVHDGTAQPPLTVGAGAAAVKLAVQGSNSQTADLLQLKNSGGTILTAFQADGKLVFGPSGSQDTNLYRDSAGNTLKTDDKLVVGQTLDVLSGSLTVTGTSSSNAEIGFSANIRGKLEAVTTSATSLAITGKTYTDASYGVLCTPTWDTTCFVSNRTATGFTLNFGTAAPASATVDWLVTR